MKHWYSKHKRLSIILGIVLVVFIAGAYWFGKNGNSADGVTKVEKGDVSETVTLAGNTAPASSVDLGFDHGGRVVSVSVKIGDKVSAGRSMVSLDSSELFAQREDALAGVNAAKAKLDQLKQGTRPEQLSIREAEAESARVELEDSIRVFNNAYLEAYTEADNAVRNLADQFFDNPRSVSAVYNRHLSDINKKIDLSFSRRRVEDNLVDWQESLSLVSTNNDKIDSYYSQSREYLLNVRNLLDLLASAVNEIYYGETTSILSGLKNDVYMARNNVDTVLASLTSSYKEYSNAKSAHNIAERQLDLAQAGNQAQDIAAQEAAVQQAEAKYNLIQAQINKNTLVAPISGTVNRQEAKVGEMVVAGQVLISILNEASLEIEANVPEVDIGKIKIGDPVEFTFDAFGREKFFGRVTFIDPAETIVEGIVNYKIKVGLNKEDSRLKSGLTANLDIKTIEKKDVLVLPQSAIIETENGAFVRVEQNGEVVQKPVKIGVRSSDGLVEMSSGVMEGQEVLVGEGLDE